MFLFHTAKPPNSAIMFVALEAVRSRFIPGHFGLKGPVGHIGNKVKSNGGFTKVALRRSYQGHAQHIAGFGDSNP